MILIGDIVKKADQTGEVFLVWHDGCVAVQWDKPQEGRTVFPQADLEFVSRPDNLVFFKMEDGMTGRVILSKKE